MTLVQYAAGHCGKCGAPYQVDLGKLAGDPTRFIPSCQCWNLPTGRNDRWFEAETPVHPRDTRCPGKVDGEHQWERWENESTGETGMECAVCGDGYPTLSV